MGVGSSARVGKVNQPERGLVVADCVSFVGCSEGRGVELINRVLDVERGQLCFVIGTVYADMALKPNVIEDLAREVSTASSTSHHPKSQPRHCLPRALISARGGGEAGWGLAQWRLATGLTGCSMLDLELRRRAPSRAQVLLGNRRSHARGRKWARAPDWARRRAPRRTVRNR